ncbi:MAG: tyrosine--tRNA ligase [Acidimicrobiaceae bacterium]|jgi:tyrosyl-tRNA synthetase|nr:tyrosine--tRNA ligase [Acidimicrobiaceae bacterium]|tara:strand:+ start:2472 stop:3818 length:1347 start_codon:yes stop_codon:yes gene_type:complete
MLSKGKRAVSGASSGNDDGVNEAEILDDLAARGLIQDCTDRDALRSRLDEGPITVYCGFDPTADSLHIGHLTPLLMLRRFQDAGHRAVALAGGATGMVGDPSGRSEERNLLDQATIDSNVEAVSGQLRSLLRFEGDGGLDGPPAILVDNREWTAEVGLLEFLRDVGKHVTVGTMLAKESVRSRLSGDQGISFTEFSYMLLQANDFFELHGRYGCEMQVGGSDQWGNITAGIDLIRRRSGASAHGMTLPLLTRSDGSKFGKTADGTVWLNPVRTMPFEMHQYFRNVDDRDVGQYLLRLTLLEVDEVATVMADHVAHPEERLAQRRLADEVCALVHGGDETARARLAAEGLFGESPPTLEVLEALRGTVPETEVSAEVLEGDESLVDALVASGLCSSRGDARRTIGGGGISVNGVRQDGDATRLADGALVGGRYVLLQKGKRSRHLLVAG